MENLESDGAAPDPVKMPMVRQEQRPASCEVHGEYSAKGFAIGKTMRWMGCPQCTDAAKAAADTAQAEYDAKRRQERMEDELNCSGIPFRYRGKDFQSFIADTDGKEKALTIAMEFVQNISEHAKKGTTLMFLGKPGTGKTHLAASIAQALMPLGTVLYTSAIDAVRMVRDTWRRDSPKTETQVLSTLAGLGLLVLDEVGVQYGTDAEQVTLFDIIDKRYRDMMPTILISNEDPAGMRKFLGDRSFDRLKENGQWVKFDWPSVRGK